MFDNLEILDVIQPSQTGFHPEVPILQTYPCVPPQKQKNLYAIIARLDMIQRIPSFLIPFNLLPASMFLRTAMDAKPLFIHAKLSPSI